MKYLLEPKEKITEQIGPIKSKELIKTFNNLDKEIDLIDKFVTRIGIAYSSNCSSAMEIYEEIIRLIKRKKLVLEIQEIIISAVDKLEGIKG